MSEQLFKKRGQLEVAYSKANAAVATAQKTCRAASEAVQKFDAAHPEVMREVHGQAGAIKKAARAEEIAAAAASEVAE